MNLYDLVTRVIGFIFFGGIAAAFGWACIIFPANSAIGWIIAVCLALVGACSAALGADVVINGLNTNRY